MINLMYVVLMAMLALNVSSDVLNGFSLVSESLNRTTHGATEGDALLELGRVPGQIKVHHHACGLEVQPHAAGLRGKQHAAVRIRPEVLQLSAPAVLSDAPRMDCEADSGLLKPLFDKTEKQVVFVPYATSATKTDPSYHLPAFYRLWAEWADNHQDFYTKLAEKSHEMFPKFAHATTGLMPDYANFDGTPNGEGGNWYAVVVPNDTAAKPVIAIGSEMEYPGPVAAVCFTAG